MLLALVLAFQAAAKKPDPPLPPFDVAKITARVEELGKANGDAPLVIAVAKDHAIVVEKAFGARDGKPLEPGADFGIGSLAHQFTAALALNLIDEGKLALDDDVAKHLSDADFPPGEGRVNVGQLLAHTSGVAWEFREKSNVAPIGIAHEPGTFFGVDRADWEVVTRLVEKVGGAPWRDLVARQLFARIGISPQPIEGHDTAMNGDPYPSLRLTAHDLVRWNKALLEREVVSEKGSRRLMTPTVLADGSSTNYGIAVGMRRYGDFKVYSATSASSLGSARLAYYSLPHVTVVVLCDRVAPVESIEREIGRIVLGLATPATKDEPIAPELAARVVGTYRVAERDLRVSVRDGRLFLAGWRANPISVASQDDYRTVRLTSQGDGTFVPEDLHEESVTFSDEKEHAASLTITLDSLVWTAKRVE